MGKISIEIQDRSYRLTCGDGDEARLTELATYVAEKADALTSEHGQISEAHLLLMSAILVADELFDLRSAELPSAGKQIEKDAEEAA